MVLLNLGCSFFGLIFSVPDAVESAHWDNSSLSVVTLELSDRPPKHVLLPLCVSAIRFLKTFNSAVATLSFSFFAIG